MVIDIPTLAIFLSLTNLMQVIALSVQYAMNREQPGVRWWLLGTAAIATGFLFNYLREMSAIAALAIFLNNVFFITGTACLYVGVLRYFGKRENRRGLILFGAIFLGLIFFFTFGYDELAARRVLISTALAALTLITAHALWKYKTRAVTVSANFLTIVFFGYGIFFVMRALSPFFAGPVGDIFSATATQVATYVVVLCVSTLWTLGFVLLVNQHLTQSSLEAQAQMELMFNTEPDATVLTRMRDGVVIRVNDGFTAMTGYTRAEMVGKTMLGLNLWKYPEHRQKFVAFLSEKGYYDNQEAIFQCKDGSELFTLGSGKIISLNDEPHILTVTRDITEKKRAEASLRESEVKHRVLFQNSPDAYLIVADGIFVDCNHAAEVMLRGERAQIIGKTPDALSPEFQPDGRASREAVVEKIKTAFALGSTNFEWMHRRLDGTDFLVDVSVAAITLEGKPALFITWRDITERKRADQALKESEQRLQDVINNNTDGMLVVDQSYRVVLANPAAIHLLHQNASELMNTEFGYVVADEPVEVEVLRNDTHAILEITSTNLVWNSAPAQLITLRDITARKRSENLINARLELIEYSATHVLDEVLQKTLDLIGDMTNSPIGFYHFVASDQKTLALQAWSTRTLREFCQARGQGLHYSIDEAGVWADCVRTKQATIHNDYATLPNRKGMPEGHAQVVRELVVPITRNENAVAILGVGNKPTEYTPADVDLVRYFADVAWEITQRKRAEEALRESEEKFHQMADLLPQIIFESDARGNLTFVNRQAYETFGYPAGFSIVGIPSLTFHVPAERPRVLESIRARMIGQPFENHEYNMLRQDGTTFPALVYSTPILKDEKPVGLRGLIVDITERKQMEQELRETNAYLENLINYANAPIIVWDPQFRITRFNHAFEVLTGRIEKQVLGQSLEWLFPPELAEDSMGLIRQTSSGEHWETVEIKIRHRDGTVRTVLWNSATLFAADGTTPIATIAQGQDITERKRLEEELQEQATTDVLTGAFNRRRFIELATYELKRAARLKVPSALAIIDLDHFKLVNDTYGHAAGDQALQTFTRICKENIREIDVFARFGGDEFAMLLPCTDGKQAYQIVERIRAAIAAQPTILDGKPVALTLSAGVAFAQADTITVDELLTRADRALYESKTQGRNHVTVNLSEWVANPNDQTPGLARDPA